MRNATRLMLVGALGVVGALGGCASSGGASAVSISNLSDAPLTVRASLDVPAGAFDAEKEQPVTTSEVTLEPGSQAGFTLEHPGVDAPSVQFVIRVPGDASIQPYTFRMSPPAPFLLKITGPASDLRLERERVRPMRDQDGLVPDDPRERRWKGGFPS
ncbi:MAG: hypothetical protein R3B57_06155 [Phycisphaerales bacterium]